VSDTMQQPMMISTGKRAATSIDLKFRGALSAIPPTGLVILSVCSTQVGAALAKDLFTALGSVGTVALRVGFAALVLFIFWRPRIRGYTRTAYVNCFLFGLALAAMNFCFYSALAHIPLGVAVTLEFVGPLGVAVLGSRRLLDVLWVAMAGTGIVCLAPWTGATFDLFGMMLALTAGGCWAAYIILSARVGRSIPGVSGLALAMGVAALLLIPLGVANSGVKLFEPRFLMIGVGIALLSSVIPYSMEIEALRRLPTRVFGLLMSMEPAIAALVGLIFLGETIGLRSLFAMVLITIATVGTIVGAKRTDT
jgi:inner membrane transporter RhtA